MICKLKLKIQHIPLPHILPEIKNSWILLENPLVEDINYAEFELSDFHVNLVKPVISDLIGEIENAFDIPEHLLEFSATVSQTMPSDVIALEKFGEQEIKSLACFYGSISLISRGKKSVKPIANVTSLEAQFDI